ncbi:MAG: co-chaperone HscB [Thioalkalispiraceae bacterium]|jgi:molecular chaperone HscB
MALAQNHFELFGLPVSFDIDLQQLSERFRDLQRSVHPDRYANASDRERRLAVEKAAQINEAFQTLKSPLNRARYMLQLRGVDFDNERDTHLDPMFLMEQMELREALGEVKSASDPLTALAKAMDDIRQRHKAMINELASLLENEASTEEGKQAVQKLQFLNKLQQEAEAIEEELAGY